MPKKKYKDIQIGEVYGRWNIIDGPYKDGRRKKWKCKCSCDNSTIRMVEDNQLKAGRSKSCGCYKEEWLHSQNPIKEDTITFYKWCKSNNRMYYLKRWDDKLNKHAPESTSIYTHDKVWLKCDKHPEHGSEQYVLSHLPKKDINIERFKCSKCSSFGQWCVDNDRLDILQRWDCELNKKSPFAINIETPVKYYLKCPRGIHNSESKLLNSFKHERWLGFDCKQCNSFGQWIIDTYGEEYLNCLWNNDKNECTPFSLGKQSNKKVWLNCTNNASHQPYQVTLNHFHRNVTCPICSREQKSKLQNECLQFVHNLGFTVKSEYDCSLTVKHPENNYVMPYDMEIVELKMLCEIHGEQHYKLLSDDHPWLRGMTPDEYLLRRQQMDDYKRYMAIKNGYSFIEIPFDSYDDNSYQDLILQAINKIIKL